MLAMNVIEPAQTYWDSLIVLVPKKDGCLRFFVDYHLLNAVAFWNLYQIPGIDKYLGSLGDATIFLILEATSGY